MSHDFAKICRQFLRTVRNRRSQVAFSRRLGFQSNVAAQWESGRRIPRALTALQACERTGIDVRAALSAFRPSTGHFWSEGRRPLTKEAIAGWLDAQRGKESVAAVARRTSLSRHRAARFFSGYCEPRLHDFFAIVEATTGRLSDLVALLVDIDRVSELSGYHAQVVASRRLAFDEPWSSAVLSAVECLGALEHDEVVARITKALELDRKQVVHCLRALTRANVIRRSKGKYHLAAPLVVDTSADPDGARRLRQHWTSVAHRRLESLGDSDVFSYNVFSVSKEDLLSIGRLQREHFQRIRAIVARSSGETVALLNMQLMEWPID